MITYMPMMRFGAAAQKLSTKDLREQLKNAQAIAQILALGDAATREQQNLEEVRMWKDYEYSLALYGMMMANEARAKRRLFNSMDYAMYFSAAMRQFMEEGLTQSMPPWAVDRDIVRSHRSRLIRSDPEHYAPLFPNTPLRMPTLWPQLVKAEQCGYRLRLKTVDIKRLNRGERELPEWLYYDPNKNEVCRRAEV